jgi:hypothetical protein
MKKYKKEEVSMDVSNGWIDHHGRLFPHDDINIRYLRYDIEVKVFLNPVIKF